MMNFSSDSDTDESEHELGYYVKNKVKLMKEVLKLIKPKKIKSMAPDCMKDSNIAEINSMLLEELLGISNKRLNYIFKGENVDRESSSSDSDVEKDVIDVISLDDISDDDIALCIPPSEINLLSDNSERSKKRHSTKIKTEKRDKLNNKEKGKRNKKNTVNKKPVEPRNETNKDQLMSVLELLELQARARAIRSQLALEHENKTGESSKNTKVKNELNSDSDDAVIIESPQHKEIVITSDSDDCSRLTKHSSQTDGLLNLNISPKIIDSQQQQSIEVLVNDVQSSVNENEEKDLEVVVVEDSSQTASNNNLENEDSNKQCGNPNHTESDNNISAAKKRKLEKTSLKTQKIKLVRNKVLKEDPKSIDSTNVDIIECSEKDTENEHIIKPLDEVIIKVESDTDTTKRNAESNNDDVDEIVINLDEDEMDGIENG